MLLSPVSYCAVWWLEDCAIEEILLFLCVTSALALVLNSLMNSWYSNGWTMNWSGLKS